MEAWERADPSGGESSGDVVERALDDLVLRSRPFAESPPQLEQVESELEQRVAARTAQLEEAGRRKDTFLAMLSHELRTPLMPAQVALDALQSRQDLPPGVRDLLSVIRRNIRLEARLIDDLLDLTRVARGKLTLKRQPTDAHAAVMQAIEVCQAEINGKGLTLVAELGALFATVFGDSARLQQVFWNLIENAVKFTPPGGKIICRSENEKNVLKISITDSGKGIDPKLLPHIFEAFEQGDTSEPARLGGLGLGLAIARGLVKAHGGKMIAASEGLYRGATFTVELPLVSASEPALPIEPAIAPIPATARAPRLLLVDDHDDTRQLLHRLLHEQGYTVTTAADVRSAIEALDRQPFDLLISDIGLPDGTGHDLMRHARDRHHVKGIALSGFAMDDNLKLSEAAGFTAHLNKPVDFAKLKATIDQVAEKS
jgi:signal transduction histidine kinase